VKFPQFRYHSPESLAEATELLAELGDDGKVLAGGQSLLSLLAMRLSHIDDLVDAGRIGALRGIAVRDSRVEVKAFTRHADLERNAIAAREVPLAGERVLGDTGGHNAEKAVLVEGVEHAAEY
jgi:aerobic carbon-monoxide dehydrogenase medium subunit